MNNLKGNLTLRVDVIDVIKEGVKDLEDFKSKIKHKNCGIVPNLTVTHILDSSLVVIKGDFAPIVVCIEKNYGWALTLNDFMQVD